jgi:hypothetical protein
MEDNKIALPKEFAYDRGGKGKSEIKGVKSSFRLRRKRAIRIIGNKKTQTMPGQGGHRTDNQSLEI